MSIVVTKRSPEVVSPSEPWTPTGDIHLSRFDKDARCVAVPLVLLFDKPIVDPVENIRRALSRALVHYYPIAGRLAAGADGCEVITCAGEGHGVLLVAASASCAVDALLRSSPPAVLSDLLVHYPEEARCRHADPLLLMQVTEFSCGGFAVGVTWNHVVADGKGIGQFLQAVGELARGTSPPSIIPVRSDESVLAAQPRGSFTTKDFSCVEHTEGMAFLDFTLPWRLISRVKALCTCTVLEAVVALVWQCRARALIAAPDVDPVPATSLHLGCNVRGFVGAAGGYYGNCLVTTESVAAPSAEVANGDIIDVVKLIKIAKQNIQANVKSCSDPAPAVRHRVGYNTLVASSWRNIGLEEADFGGGRPARVIWYAPKMTLPFFVLCPPWKGNDQGVNVLGYIVKKEHVDAFMREIGKGGERVN
ncbi:acyl transferase 15-like [Aegilops tauschii subsp. strangulata]|uniref:acyl transferase 15-like n=1 Tax=Aegilops tauschii subsp. strangulata TaxID=200361 RepID=UPI00098B023E|nr:acyl transferase 15-like [Aegilops tauschii subsp. strangulata]